MRKLLLFALVACLSPLCYTQSFDHLKGASPVKLNEKLQKVLDANDAKGLEKILNSKPGAKEEGSKLGKNAKGAPRVIPFFFDVIERALNGEVSMDVCRVAFNSGCDLYPVFNGKTPVYRVMDYLATTPSAQAARGMEVLDLLLSADTFDINRSYGSLPPPFSYLLSENYNALGGKYSKEYLSTELIQNLIDHGARLNTYDENGASLLLLANSTENEYLQNYLIDHGVNINKVADNAGNNALYAAIESGNVPQLQRLVKNYQITLTTAYVQDRTARVSSEMYDYLARECANNSSDYSSITTFRNHFSDKKHLVQSKYEDLARVEVAQANNYESIMACKLRYPDLNDITDPKFNEIASNDLNAASNIVELKVCEKRYPNTRALIDLKKRAFYHIDMLNLEDSFSYAQHLVSIGSFVHEKKMSEYADWFLENYQNYYDPEEKSPLAKDLHQFYSALENMRKGYYTTYIKLPNPKIFWEEMNSDHNRLKSAYTSLAHCGHGLSSDAMLNTISQAIETVEKIADKNIREYQEFCETLRKNMRVKSHTGPHGDLFGGSDRCYSEEGEIIIDLGIPYQSYIITVYYNAYFRDISRFFDAPNYQFDCYKITGVHGYQISISYYEIEEQESSWSDKYKQYKSAGELEQDIVNKIYRYYCSFLR